MGNYSKFIGTVGGGLAGIAATYIAGKMGLPVEDVQNWIVAGGAAVATYFFPANRPT